MQSPASSTPYDLQKAISPCRLLGHRELKSHMMLSEGLDHAEYTWLGLWSVILWPALEHSVQGGSSQMFVVLLPLFL
ncbi:hypothetical protein RHGRI_037769 [Rhododendron griersonianum]|uniref:Uncharacterized protein n=1 Tax=Rhododendron griersonianum TaxID=479676 RepID=A0AAV6HSZ7_9ERIC|nr:hypothetical protein RHGRI_037769 [Rhododendron griersonianum]